MWVSKEALGRSPAPPAESPRETSGCTRSSRVRASRPPPAQGPPNRQAFAFSAVGALHTSEGARPLVAGSDQKRSVSPTHNRQNKPQTKRPTATGGPLLPSKPTNWTDNHATAAPKPPQGPAKAVSQATPAASASSRSLAYPRPSIPQPLCCRVGQIQNNVLIFYHRPTIIHL